MTQNKYLKNVVEILEDKKGENIIVYNISPVSSLADYFVICSGNSDVHIKSLTDNLVKELKNQKRKPYAIDGYKTSKWVCVDLGDIMVHIMGYHERNHYNLESIWGDCEKVLVK